MHFNNYLSNFLNIKEYWALYYVHIMIIMMTRALSVSDAPNCDVT
jgi:hypothetical protein